GLIPAPVLALGVDEPLHAPGEALRALSGRVQREQRPGGLRGGALAEPHPLGGVIGTRVLAPAPVVVLVALEPAHRAPDARLRDAHAGGDQGRDDRAGA